MRVEGVSGPLQAVLTLFARQAKEYFFVRAAT
jgi:hypothetical protein